MEMVDVYKFIIYFSFMQVYGLLFYFERYPDFRSADRFRIAFGKCVDVRAKSGPLRHFAGFKNKLYLCYHKTEKLWQLKRHILFG